MTLGLTAPPLDLNIDGASFGDSHANSGHPCAPANSPACLDLTPMFNPGLFGHFSIDRPNDVLVSNGGPVAPGQTATLLFAVTIEQYGPGVQSI